MRWENRSKQRCVNNQYCLLAQKIIDLVIKDSVKCDSVRAREYMAQGIDTDYFRLLCDGVGYDFEEVKKAVLTGSVLGRKKEKGKGKRKSDTEEIITMFNAGFKVREIAEVLGRPPRSLWGIISWGRKKGYIKPARIIHKKKH